MLLKNLKIFSNGIEIRNIPFKTGLNLILDNETILTRITDKKSP